MKELLLQYAQYNKWANELIIDAMLGLGDGDVDKEVNSSFPTLRRTVLHTWGAESIWLQRLQLAEHPVWHGEDVALLFDDVCNRWQSDSEAIIRFVAQQYDDRALAHIVEFYDRQKTTHKMPVYQVLHHVFNHATYHRGQMVTMLRQAGATKIPGTDFVGFVRLAS